MRAVLSVLLIAACCSAVAEAKTCKVIDNTYESRGPNPAPFPVAVPYPMSRHSQEEASADLAGMLKPCAEYVKNMYFNQERNYLWCLAEHGFIRQSYRIFVPRVDWNCWFLYPNDSHPEIAAKEN